MARNSYVIKTEAGNLIEVQAYGNKDKVMGRYRELGVSIHPSTSASIPTFLFQTAWDSFYKGMEAKDEIE